MRRRRKHGQVCIGMNAQLVGSKLRKQTNRESCDGRIAAYVRASHMRTQKFVATNNSLGARTKKLKNYLLFPPNYFKFRDILNIVINIFMRART